MITIPNTLKKAWLNVAIGRLVWHPGQPVAYPALPSLASDVVSANCDAVDIRASAYGQATKTADYDYGALDAPPHG